MEISQSYGEILTQLRSHLSFEASGNLSEVFAHTSKILRAENKGADNSNDGNFTPAQPEKAHLNGAGASGSPGRQVNILGNQERLP